MPKFLFEGKYSVDGVKGLLKEGGSARRAAEKLAHSVGSLRGAGLAVVSVLENPRVH